MTLEQYEDMDAARESARLLGDLRVYYMLNAVLEGLECL